jgi:dTDP-4-dehydrorhamnose reductase
MIQMLLNQLKGIVLSMREIRKINPDAKLVQTEDLGKTYSTRKLKYQAKFENERRWLTYDILSGKLNEKHPLWKHLSKLSIPKEDFTFFLDNPCEPDIFGFNHYLTSERFLDERLSLYPAETHGGNGRHRYADVEAVRVELNEPSGIEVLLKEAWQRYGKPMAITEVHLHCHREEQLRWFRKVWEAATRLNKEEMSIVGVTSWAMLGSYGWNRLLTERGGLYEPGIFDLRGGKLRPTALAGYVRNLASKNEEHPHLSLSKGWWERSSRLIFNTAIKPVRMKPSEASPLLIIGKNGTLGKALARVCEERWISYELLSRIDCDISDPVSIEAAIQKFKPWGIINAAGYVRVDEAETDQEACFRDNTLGASNLA